MASRDDTRLLGLHGLYIEAQRRDDAAAAQLYAEEAAKHAPAPAWAGQAVLEFRCAAGDWAGALERLDRNMKSGLIDKPPIGASAPCCSPRARSPPRRAIATARRPLALEAVKLAPTLVPAAALAGAAARRGRRAAQGRAHHRGGLAGQSASRSGGDLCASAAGRFGARAAGARAGAGGEDARQCRSRAGGRRAPRSTRRNSPSRGARSRRSSIAPTQRVAMLMAELEEMEHGDEGRAREWMARALQRRRDPAWTADGFVSERWMPVSPVTGRLDAFQWKDPLAGLDGDAR